MLISDSFVVQIIKDIVNDMFVLFILDTNGLKFTSKTVRCVRVLTHETSKQLQQPKEKY